jgi:hypothetical protein
MSVGAPARRLHLVFLIRSFGFPEGMAATNRVRLLGRALVEQDVDVGVLCTRVSEWSGEERNWLSAGVADGIWYRYTTGSTTRSDSFVRRRLVEARGYVTALLDLEHRRRQGSLDCVFLTALPDRWSLGLWMLLRRLRSLDVPVIVDLNEQPSDLTRVPGAVGRAVSHLDSVSGVVAISDWLVAWAAREAARIRRVVLVTKVSIVVDLEEAPAVPYPDGPPRLVYSASTEYAAAMTFILRTMRSVWERHPDCRLVVTGMRPAAVASLLEREGLDEASGLVEAVGYVDRKRLLRLYGEASALLIPLFDDMRSRARFPTKIGEYLAASRPIVTTAVGEIERFFRDGETAFIARPDDPGAYAAAVIAALDDPAAAGAVGKAGRRLAEQHFEFSGQGPALRTFLDAVCALPASGRRRPRRETRS